LSFSSNHSRSDIVGSARIVFTEDEASILADQGGHLRVEESKQARSTAVQPSMAGGTEGDQVLLGIISTLTTELFVVNL
jgi:hypothetical protein